jgi:endonuclease/exonuclease/phosphatase family metal-dependent hydrolase
MRIAAYNVENMFERPVAMNMPEMEEGRPALEDHAELNNLIAKENYSASDKNRMLEIMESHPRLLQNRVSKFLRLREYRNKLTKKSGGEFQIAVDRRDEWVGWFELVAEPLNATAIDNTGRIVREIGADILSIVEADDRTALKHFNEVVLPRVNAAPYEHVMLIDGNDDRGIDVGIVTRRDFPIQSIISHVHDVDGTGTIFSRDCAEYMVPLSGGDHLLLMVNHFKSKGFGSQASSNAKRKRQSTRVRAIYDQRLAEGHKLIAVLGDLNDVPNSDPLKPLVGNGSTLTDIMVHAKFVGDDRPGTHGNGTQSSKIDYILMSPDLADRVTAGGIERRGVFGGANGTLFPHLPEIVTRVDSASDHAGLFVDVA